MPMPKKELGTTFPEFRPCQLKRGDGRAEEGRLSVGERACGVATADRRDLGLGKWQGEL